jgi:hypothetical protein
LNQSARTARTTRKQRVTPIPENFAASDAVKAWAKDKGFGDLDLHLEHFTTKAQAKDYRYADWDAAFKGAIREDWAKLRTGRNANPMHADDVFAGNI